MYRCIANINKNALLNNLSYLKKIGDCNELIFMVKANAYGHGLAEVASILQDCVDISFGVAALEEAEILRELGIKGDILLFDGGAFIGDELDVIDWRVTPVVSSFAAVKCLNDALAKKPPLEPYKIHIKIDTGFVRNGIYFEDLISGFHDDMVEFLAKSELLQVEGVATHFCCADVENDSFSHFQQERFYTCLKYLELKGLKFTKVHMANSAGILRNLGNEARFDGYQVLARPGLAAYGISPINSHVHNQHLQAVMQIEAQVVAIKSLVAGQGIGYGHSFTASGPTHVAIVAMGYGDGLRRSLSNRGHMIASGIKVPIVGTISMDSCAIDITAVINKLGPQAIAPGQMVTVLGSDGDQEISASELAKLDGTISWEILTSIAERLTRKVIF